MCILLLKRNSQFFESVSYTTYSFGFKYAVLAFDTTTTITPVLRLQVPVMISGRLKYKSKRLVINIGNIKQVLAEALFFLYGVYSLGRDINLIDSDEFISAIKWSQDPVTEELFVSKIYERVGQTKPSALKIVGFNLCNENAITTKSSVLKFISVSPVSGKAHLDVRMGGSVRVIDEKYTFCVNSYDKLCCAIIRLVALIVFSKKINESVSEAYILCAFLKLNSEFLLLLEKHCLRLSVKSAEMISFARFYDNIKKEINMLDSCCKSTHKVTFRRSC